MAQIAILVDRTFVNNPCVSLIRETQNLESIMPVAGIIHSPPNQYRWPADGQTSVGRAVYRAE